PDGSHSGSRRNFDWHETARTHRSGGYRGPWTGPPGLGLAQWRARTAARDRRSRGGSGEREVKRALLLAGAALALTSAFVAAQDAPESLLPPGFDRPAPRPARAAPAPAPTGPAAAAPAQGQSSPVIQPLPVAAPRSGAVALPSNLPSLDQLEAMSPDELDKVLDLRPKDDIPPAARRAMTRVGVIDEGEGGLPFWNLGKQDPDLVRAVLQGNSGKLVSRWGHILLRRAVASRLDAPAGMDPAEFAALRAALLVRMGEGDGARSLVQDVDTANYSPELTQAALDAYVATGDFTGIC